MLPKGAAKKVTIYLNEDTRHHLDPVWSVVFEFLKQKRVAGASVMRPAAGFGSHAEVHDAASEYSSAHNPVRVEFVETAARVDELLPALYDIVTDGLIEVQDTTIVKSVAKDKAPKHQPAPAAARRTDASGPAKLVRIYLGESDQFQNEPLYEAIVMKLRMLDFAGATVYRGILGYGVKRHTHRAGILQFSRDLPVMIAVVERAERLDELLRVVSEMIQDGLIAVSDIQMHRILTIPESAESVADA